jgi:hypothetical protein
VTNDGANIVREPSRVRWTTIDNRTIEDDRLTFRALGLLVYLLSRPDYWKAHVNHLCATHEEGREAVRTALGELERFGYVTRRWVRPAGNDTPVMEYVVRETAACPEIGNPGNRGPRNTDAQESAPSNDLKEDLVTDLSNTPATSVAGSASRAVAKCSAERSPTRASRDQRTAARDIVKAWWDAQDPRPVSNFLGVVGVVAKFIAAGYPLDRVIHALNDASVPTTNSMLLELNRDKPARRAPMPAAVVDQWKKYAASAILPQFREAAADAR